MQDKIQTIWATSFDHGYNVGDYPYGFKLRTTIRYWVEEKFVKGELTQRVVTCTLNPKTDQWNKPKAGVYSPLAVIFVDKETGRVESRGWTFYDGYEALKAFRDTYALSEEQNRFVIRTLNGYEALYARRARAAELAQA